MQNNKEANKTAALTHPTATTRNAKEKKDVVPCALVHVSFWPLALTYNRPIYCGPIPRAFKVTVFIVYT